MAVRDLVGTLAPTETVRGVANEYVRQLLDEIARRLEQLATSEPAKAEAGF
jgi:cell division septum initiation protein DivIVA